jgi:uncharacterized protein YdaU (DUF1376 family)
MSGRPDSFMPLYIGDYIRDTGHLSTSEHGAYMLLIMHYWTSREPLPADETRLARIAKCSKQQWAESRDVVLAFFELKDGRYHHGRVEMELTRAAKVYKERSEAGRKGNAKRWQKHRKAIAEPSQTGSQNDPNHNHTATQEGSPSELPSCDSSARPASRRVKTAPPVALEVPPGWEQKSEKWADFRSKLSDGEWRAWFSKARLNGSELSLLLDSEFAKEQVLYRYAKMLEEHFGRRVSLTFDPDAYQAALDKNP